MVRIQYLQYTQQQQQQQRSSGCHSNSTQAGRQLRRRPWSTMERQAGDFNVAVMKLLFLFVSVIGEISFADILLRRA